MTDVIAQPFLNIYGIFLKKNESPLYPTFQSAIIRTKLNFSNSFHIFRENDKGDNYENGF